MCAPIPRIRTKRQQNHEQYAWHTRISEAHCVSRCFKPWIAYCCRVWMGSAAPRNTLVFHAQFTCSSGRALELGCASPRRTQDMSTRLTGQRDSRVCPDRYLPLFQNRVVSGLKGRVELHGGSRFEKLARSQPTLSVWKEILFQMSRVWCVVHVAPLAWLRLFELPSLLAHKEAY